jgi:glucosylceramidase
MKQGVFPEKNLYLTEQSVTELRSGPLGIAEPVRRVMIGATRNWCRSQPFGRP